MDVVYNNGVGELCDLAETRRALQARRSELLAECTANSRLQQRFDQIAVQLSGSSSTSSGSSSGSSIGSSIGSRSSVGTSSARINKEPTSGFISPRDEADPVTTDSQKDIYGSEDN